MYTQFKGADVYITYIMMEIIREMTTSLTYLGFNKLAIHIFRRLSPIRVNMALLVVGVQVNTLTCLKNFVSKVNSM